MTTCLKVNIFTIGENTNEETRMLKLMVHKLNKELSKYQKHGIDINDLNADEDFDEKTTNDLTKLGPLIVAYDEELHEKDEIIAEYEKQLYNLKIQ